MRETTIRPAHSILDRRFKWVPASATSVADTWRRFGWRPLTDEERKERLRRSFAFLFDGDAARAVMKRAAPAGGIRRIA